MDKRSPLFLIMAVLLIVGPFVALAKESDQMQPDSKLEAGLTESVKQSGIVRVIVEVAASEPLKENQEVRLGYCENVDCAILRLERSLENSDIGVFEPLEGLPLVVMEIDEEGLLQLENSPYVVRVTADGATGIDPIENDSGELSAPQ